MHRRSFLEMAGCAGLVALAGCAGVLDGSGSGERGDSIRATTRWAVPAAATEDPLAGYELRSVEPAGILRAHDEITADAVADRLASQSLLQRHVDVADVDRFVEVEPVGRPPLEEYVVFEGEFETGTAIESLGTDPNLDLQQVGTHGEYEIYDSSPGFAIYAVGDGTIVEVDRLRNEGVEPADVEVILDAASGETDRIADQHDGLRATADRLEPSHHLGLRIEDPGQSTDAAGSQFAGVVASGNTAEIRGEQLELRTVVTFESERAREVAPIDRWLEEAAAQAPSGDVSETVDGRFVEATVTLPTESLYG